MRIQCIGSGIKGFRQFIKMGQACKISSEAEYRLKVIIAYQKKFKENASLTGRYFGLHRNTVMKYLKLYDPHNLHSLEPKDRVPIKTYRIKTDPNIINVIIRLKRAYPAYGKVKIQTILERDEKIKISTSTIGRVFKKYKLIYLWRNKKSTCDFKKTIRKRGSRLRPPKVFYATKPGQWIQIDTVKIGFSGSSVYVINAIDLYSRLAVSYAYRSPSSKNTRDFLFKLNLFFPKLKDIEMIQTDNGSEFLKYFDQELKERNIKHTFSYPKHPKMNCFIESYNKTIQIECLQRQDALKNIEDLNDKIAKYLVEYNTFRPHQSLKYEVPLAVFLKHYSHLPKVHTMIWTHSRSSFIYSNNIYIFIIFIASSLIYVRFKYSPYLWICFSNHLS